MKFRIAMAALATGALAVTAGCGSDSDPDASAPTSAAENTPVVIASQNFPEAALVSEMYSQLLAAAGYSPTVKLVATRDAYMADFPGGVDVVPEYVGGIVNFLNSAKNGADAEPFTAGDGEELAADGKSLLDDQGITLLDVSSATDTNAFFVTTEYAEANGLSTLSDLAGMSVTLAAAPDCEGRLDCAGGLEDSYGIDITEILPLGYASDQTYQSVIDGESQLGETSTTDGTLESLGLMVLEDDMQIQPAQNLVPAVSTDFLEANPDLADVLNPLMAALTTEDLTSLNGQISVDRMTPEEVALAYLTDEGLL
ncbi:MAG: ABC transporter substrate-binding protein [Nocardioides sp.]